MMMTTKYEKIHLHLQDRLFADAFPDGKLPPLVHLTKTFKANAATVSKAVKLLERDNLVICGPGSAGTVINSTEVKRQRRLRNFYRVDERLRDDAPGTTLRYAILRQGGRGIAVYEDLIRSFHEEYPGIRIDLVEPHANQEVLEDRVPDLDVFQFPRRDQPLLVRRGRLLDLRPMRERLPHEPGAAPAAMDEGMGTPFLFNTPVMLVNRALLSGPIRTWEDLRPTMERGGVWLDLWPLTYFYHWIGRIPENLPDAANAARLAAAVGMFRLMQTSRGVIGGHHEVPKTFTDGSLPVYIAYFLPDIPARLPFPLGIAPPPLPCGLPPIAEMVLHGVSPRCAFPVEAYLFCRYMASPSAQRRLAESRNGLPVHREAWREDRLPGFDPERLAGSNFSLGLSSQSLDALDGWSMKVMETGFRRGEDDASLAAKIQRRAAEFMALDEFR